MSAGGARERGYALVLAAVAVLFLALAASVIVRAGVAGSVAATHELEQAQSALTAQAGQEWIIGVARTGWGTPMTRSFPPGGGTMTVERTGTLLRAVRSTGRRGGAVRVCVTDLTLFYVPGSRHSGSGTSVVFEAYNMSGTNVALTGVTPVLSQSAFLEEVRLRLLSSSPTDLADAVDFGTVWSYTTQGGGTRLGSGGTAQLSQTCTIPNGRQAVFELRGWKAAATGTPSGVQMGGVDLRVVPREGEASMAAMVIPRTP
jgi:hypothetical protein